MSTVLIELKSTLGRPTYYLRITRLNDTDKNNNIYVARDYCWEHLNTSE